MGRNMGRDTNKLTVKGVASLSAKGYHSDGRNLYLRISGVGTKSWIFRYALHGKTHDLGLGSASDVSLAQARAKAKQYREKLADGLSPSPSSPRHGSGLAWGDVASSYITSQAAGWKTEEQEQQWTTSLLSYGPDWDMPLAAVTDAVVLAKLEKIWTTKTETATRVRGRIERVWDSAKADGLVSGDNPARWKGWLKMKLPPPSKVAKTNHFKALPYKDLPAFMVKLSKRKGVRAEALRFTILTACRTSEVTGSSWGEFDDKASEAWTIPKERMKAGREHVVPLSKQALTILGRVSKDSPPFLLSENAMLYLLQKKDNGMGLPFTVHGFRSSFRDWAADTTSFPSEVVEMALAHAIKDKTEAAYRRGKLLAKRKELMQAWADYCLPPKP